MKLFFDLILLNNLADYFYWIANRYLEIIATITALIYLFYSIKGDKRCWLYGFISSGLYVYICFDYGIYADMGVNIYYVVVSIYGWIHWSRKKDAIEVRITKTKFFESLLLLIIIIGLLIIITVILNKYTNSNVVFLDALTTSASIVATWMLARKMMEHWLIWIFVDALSIGLYIYKELYFTSFLFVVYTIMAVVGYKEWKKTWEQQQEISL